MEFCAGRAGIGPERGSGVAMLTESPWSELEEEAMGEGEEVGRAS